VVEAGAGQLDLLERDLGARACGHHRVVRHVDELDEQVAGSALVALDLDGQDLGGEAFERDDVDVDGVLELARELVACDQLGVDELRLRGRGQGRHEQQRQQ
jgi:hypothetical protein